jgi:hypothetical protein
VAVRPARRRAADARGLAASQALLMPGKIQHVLSPGDLCVKVRASCAAKRRRSGRKSCAWRCAEP